VECHNVQDFATLIFENEDTLVVNGSFEWRSRALESDSNAVIVFQSEGNDTLETVSTHMAREILVNKPNGTLTLNKAANRSDPAIDARSIEIESGTFAFEDGVIAEADAMTLAHGAKLDGIGTVRGNRKVVPGRHPSLIGDIEFASSSNTEAQIELRIDTTVKSNTYRLLENAYWAFGSPVDATWHINLPGKQVRALEWDPDSGSLNVFPGKTGADGTVSIELKAGRAHFLWVEIVTGTGTDAERELPAEFTLHPAYPNPFNPSTTIPVELSETGKVVLTVYDALGRKVRTLVSGLMTAGRHEIRFDAAGLPSGTYLVTAIGERTRAHTKVVLMK
ncbi:MAG: T9SS type A sorting domain-containing protein, partial [bacterium]|nr:T9SS type A sorting domain-containing protein [bacterium]